MENDNKKKSIDKKLMIIIIVLCFITFSSTVVTATLLIKNSTQKDKGNVYPVVSQDPDAEPIEEEGSSEEPLTNPDGGGAVSLIYSNQATASEGDGIATILFQNPSKSNQSIVIQLQITDKELIEKLGKTGRTDKEKAKIEGAEDYDSEKNRMIIAESGLIPPGHKLTTLELKALPDGTVLPKGNYNAVFYILAYDKDTNERAVVNMQIPISLTILE
ncbi:MAG: hypothetical protein WBI55_04580 [Eubacteriales bacterium]